MSAEWEVAAVAQTVDGEPSRTRKAPERCADEGHPPVTYNPWAHKTWCLCGEVVRDGDEVTHADCCGGPLEEGVQS